MQSNEAMFNHSAACYTASEQQNWSCHIQQLVLWDIKTKSEPPKLLHIWACVAWHRRLLAHRRWLCRYNRTLSNIPLSWYLWDNGRGRKAAEIAILLSSIGLKQQVWAFEAIQTKQQTWCMHTVYACIMFVVACIHCMHASCLLLSDFVCVCHTHTQIWYK